MSDGGVTVAERGRSEGGARAARTPRVCLGLLLSLQLGVVGGGLFVFFLVPSFCL